MSNKFDYNLNFKNMINKNLLGFCTLVFISGTALLAPKYPAQGSINISTKKTSVQSEASEKLSQEKNQIKFHKTNLETNNIEQLNEAQTEPLKIARTIYRGKASWYGPGFHGRLTANGERYNQYAMTAAHKSLPFGTRVKVTNLNNNLSVVVRINDRGPFIRGRVIDVSAAAAQNLGMMHHGVVPVRLQILR